MQISQRPDEGGLNLNMQMDRIYPLSNAGKMAAERLIDRFHPSGREGGEGWRTHQRVRLATLLGAMQAPTAELDAVMKRVAWGDYLKDIKGYHAGEPPDARAQAHAAQRGYDLSAQRARRLRAQDFTAFDLVLVMDEDNEAAARALCPPEELHRLHRLADFCHKHATRVVPDPYYGNAQGFERVLDIVEDACEGLLECIVQARAAKAPA